jgi:hypothetical protein
VRAGNGTYVRPVERRTPARKAETGGALDGVDGGGEGTRTKDGVKGVVGESADLEAC